MSTANVEALLEGLAHQQGIAIVVLSIFLTLALLFILVSLVFICNKHRKEIGKANATVEELSLYEEKRDKMFKRFADRRAKSGNDFDGSKGAAYGVTDPDKCREFEGTFV